MPGKSPPAHSQLKALDLPQNSSPSALGAQLRPWPTASFQPASNTWRLRCATAPMPRLPMRPRRRRTPPRASRPRKNGPTGRGGGEGSQVETGAMAKCKGLRRGCGPRIGWPALRPPSRRRWITRRSVCGCRSVDAGTCGAAAADSAPQIGVVPPRAAARDVSDIGSSPRTPPMP